MHRACMKTGYAARTAARAPASSRLVPGLPSEGAANVYGFIGPTEATTNTAPNANEICTARDMSLSYVCFKSPGRMGRRRIRLPVAAKIAFATAGAIGG